METSSDNSLASAPIVSADKPQYDHLLIPSSSPVTAAFNPPPSQKVLSSSSFFKFSTDFSYCSSFPFRCCELLILLPIGKEQKKKKENLLDSVLHYSLQVDHMKILCYKILFLWG